MMTFIIIIHVIACIVLIGLVLIQRGRGSGLVESFQGVESMFGTKTNTFLTRTTTVLSVIFFLSCLSLAIFSVRQSKSLMGNIKNKPQADTAVPLVNEPASTVTQESSQEGAPKTE